MKISECKGRKWDKVTVDGDTLKVRFYKKITYKKKLFRIFIIKKSEAMKLIENKSNKISVGSYRKINGNDVVVVDYDLFVRAIKDEVDALIKHEMLHGILGHVNEKCSMETYIREHKKLFTHMTKKELINHMMLQYRIL